MYFIVAIYEQNRLLQEDAIDIKENKNFEDLLSEIWGYRVDDQKISVQFYNPIMNH